MLKYSNRNHRPLVKQLEFSFGRDYNSLYDLDRVWAIKVEKLKGRDLKLYDRDIELQKNKDFQRKTWVIKTSALLLEKSLQKTKSFKLSFNEFNGYKIEYNGKSIETYNYLYDDYVQKILNIE